MKLDVKIIVETAPNIKPIINEVTLMASPSES
jgi:hypothetical protein